MKPNVSIKKEGIKIRLEVNETEKKIVGKINEIISQFSKMTKQTDKLIQTNEENNINDQYQE